MSTIIKLENGTEYRFQAGGKSGKAVLVGSKESDLEKLLRLNPLDKVKLDSREMSYHAAKKLIGPIVAYISDEITYLKIANYL